MDYSILLLIILPVLAAFFAYAILRNREREADFPSSEPPQRAAGREGEDLAAELIKPILQKGDILLRNVPVEYDGKTTELDLLILNENGAFIVEVKNYGGELEVGEDDYEWNMYRRTGNGKSYVKSVKNPIKQVKRQIYILSKFLKANDSEVWINGYAVMVGSAASPVESEYLLSGISQLDMAIHSPGTEKLSEARIYAIIKTLDWGAKKLRSSSALMDNENR